MLLREFWGRRAQGRDRDCLNRCSCPGRRRAIVPCTLQEAEKPRSDPAADERRETQISYRVYSHYPSRSAAADKFVPELGTPVPRRLPIEIDRNSDTRRVCTPGAIFRAALQRSLATRESAGIPHAFWGFRPQQQPGYPQ